MDQNHSNITDVLVVGGGLNGPALALALAGGGLSVRVLDAAPAARLADPEFDGRAYALAASSRAMLGALGIWDEVGDRAEPILDIKVSDGTPGRGAAPMFVHFDHRDGGMGPMGHMLEDRYLRAALTKAAAGSRDITVENDAKVIAQTCAGGLAEVTLADGSTRKARLLVGADGRMSGTAERAGIRRQGWLYRQTSLVAALEVEKPHNGIAHQMFFAEGPLAILPLPGNRVSIVWTETAERAAEVSALDDDGYLAALHPRFGNFLGKISLAGARYSYPLGLSLATKLVSDRLALVGDAAHGIHPLAGQGLNLGLRDVATLAEVLVEARRRGEDIGAADVLERYRAWRQPDIAKLAVATDGINRIFSNANPMMRAGRQLGLGLVSRFPGVQKAMMRQAMGVTGNLPRLLRGQPI